MIFIFPLLFSIYAEMMMIKTMQYVKEGFEVEGEMLKDLKFADNQGMMSWTESGLKTIMYALRKTRKEYDTKINATKIKVVINCRERSKKERDNPIGCYQKAEFHSNSAFLKKRNVHFFFQKHFNKIIKVRILSFFY